MCTDKAPTLILTIMGGGTFAIQVTTAKRFLSTPKRPTFRHYLINPYGSVGYLSDQIRFAALSEFPNVP